LQLAGNDRAALETLLLPLISPSRNIRQATLAAASESLERLGNNDAAAADQQALAEIAPAPADRASALLTAGRLYHQAGNDRKAAELLARVLHAYPASSAAGAALDQLDAMGVAVDPLQRAIVLFNLRRNDVAKSAFQAVLASRPSVPVASEATYHLAVLADRAGQDADALSGYQSAAQLDPVGEFAAESLWDQAQLLESLDRRADAQNLFLELANRFPTDTHSGEAMLDAGFMAFLDNRPADAQRLWMQAAASRDAAVVAHADLWLGKLALARGDTASAAGLLKKAQTSQPAGYSGLRAAVLSAGAREPSLSGAPMAPPAADWNSVETWLSSWAGHEDSAYFEQIQRQDDWREALALNSLGWQSTPPILIEGAIANAKHHPWALYRAARALNERGLTRLAMEASDDLVDLAPGPRLSAPQTLLRLDYPLDYVGLTNRDAAEQGLDPLLVSALVRQESAFDPAVGSGAGAQGLMQLVAGTAQDAAAAVGLKNFDVADLKRPAVNLQLGTVYLQREAKAEANDLSQTLAAYNAGGGNADRWAKGSAGDADLYYEMVDFDETRQYIRLVSQNYAIYNFLYRNLPEPSLLHR
jgi:soluble lytic murein transglycosylase